MKQPIAFLVLAGLTGLAGAASADETTYCNVFITTLPYTISVQGHYCFDRNLATAITSGNAITINADFVVLDLNNFKLGGGSAGLGTQAAGVFTSNHRNITIRNGNIRGFETGILIQTLSSTGSGGILIENNVLDGNTVRGVGAIGDSIVIRNNIVANTGGSTSRNIAYGILTYAYQLVSVRDNVVSDTFGNGTSTASTYGVWTAGAGQVIDHNVIRMGAPSMTGNTEGIDTAGGICRDNTTLNATAPNICTPVGANFP